MNKTKKALIMGGLALIFAVLGFLLLPDTVIMQIGFDGEAGNVLSKPLAIIVPLLISGLGIGLYICGDGSRDVKNIVLVIIGYAVSIFELVVNL